MGIHAIKEKGAEQKGCGNPEENASSTELSFAVVQREITVNNRVELSREKFRLGKPGQISQWENV